MTAISASFITSVAGKNYIGGQFVDAKSTKRSSVFNPKDDSLIFDQHAVSGEDDVNFAVETARKAFRGPWKQLTGAERGDCLYRLADLLATNAEDALYFESICSGRLVSQLAYEVPWVVRMIRYYAGWCDKLEGESFYDEDGFYKIVKHEPLGVCVGITPWNGPLMVLAMKAAPALATGNTFILKPPEKSPLSSLFVANLFERAGFPPGVFNIVCGEGATGALLCNHMKVDKVSFTGSVSTGRRVQDAANKSNMKRVTLELGGKSPAIVFDDANIPSAAKALSQGITSNAGQVCVACSRVYVHESVADQLISEIKTLFEEIALTLGQDPQESTTSFGPVVDKAQYERVHSFIEQGKTDSTLVTGGYRYPKTGNFIPPTLFINVNPNSAIYQEEIFGPVLVIRTFKREEEAIVMANDSSFGLAGYVFTEDVKRIFRVSQALEAGSIGVNSGVALFHNVPFGGYKTSGSGKELGKYALADYQNTKTIYISTTDGFSSKVMEGTARN